MEVIDMRFMGKVNTKVICMGFVTLIFCFAMAAGATSTITKDGPIEYTGSQKVIFDTGKAAGTLDLKFLTGKTTYTLSGQQPDLMER